MSSSERKREERARLAPHLATEEFAEMVRLAHEYSGRADLPRHVLAAIREMTRQRPDEAWVWRFAARCLRLAKPTQAYRCYRRAVRLDPKDLALAEEAGMFGLTAIGARRDRAWSVYLVAARADPDRRARIDPILLRRARELPAAAVVFIAVGSLIGMLVGASALRRWHGVETALPPGVTPLPPIVGIGVALAVLLGFLALYWVALAPVKRFGREIVGRVFWRPRVVVALAVVAALASGGLSLYLASIAGSLEAFDAFAPWALVSYLVAVVLALASLPAKTSLEALIEVAKQTASGN